MAPKKWMKKSVLAKMVCAPSKAGMSDALSSRSPLMISTPAAERAFEASLEGLRDIPRTCQPGSLRKVLATAEPCWMLVCINLRQRRVEYLRAGDANYDDELRHVLGSCLFTAKRMKYRDVMRL